ncbi:MAG TPA: hypothetical protein VF796_26070, partial [Humisphaera sp.]
PAPGADPAPLAARLEAAARFRAAMLVTDADVAKLDPVARFNYVLHVARVMVPDVSDATTRAAADNLRKAIAELGDRPEVRGLAGRLDALADPEPMSVDARLLTPEPPATLAVTVRDRYELTFVRLAPAGQRPFYLATTELSLGQFIAAVDAGGDWSTANALLGNVAVPGGPGPTPFRGPRAWERPSSANTAIDRFPDFWRFDAADGAGREFAFDRPLRRTKFNARSLSPEAGGDPTYDHPMQQLSAQAGLYAAAVLNCRLPTPREWLAAYEQERAAVGDAWPKDWNLRDAAWARQAAFARGEAPGQWPLVGGGGATGAPAGVFWPTGTPRPAAASAATRGDDGVLFFRTVAAGGGTFKNLVGNVAELTCDQPDAWDHARDRKTVDGVRKFGQTYASHLCVIGGSAFSPPELDPLRPQPLASAAEPFCDVGVRLAFTAPARSTAERLKWFLDEQKYLAGPTVAGAGN